MPPQLLIKPVLGLSLIAAVFAVACGGGSSAGVGGGVGGINIQVTSPVGPAAADAGLTLAIKVDVTGDSANAGVRWTVAAQHKGDPVGTLSDIPADSVTYNAPSSANVTAQIQVTVTATSVTDPTRAATIPISVYPALAITTPPAALSTAFLNTNYTCIQQPITNLGVVQIPCQVSVTGGLGPYPWSVDPSLLPPGLQLSPGLTANDTKLVGSPTASGTYPFSISVHDSLGGTNTAALKINVAPQQLKVVTPTVLTTTVGAPYSPIVLQASTGVPPYTWSLATGSGPLPPGMTLSPPGVISGTPTSIASFSFAVRVTDSQSPVPAEATFPNPDPTNPKIITLANSIFDPICVKGSGNSVQTGTPYAFLISGFDADGPVTVSGSFTSDASGNLSGVEDIIRASGAQTGLPLASGSLIGFNQVGRGCLTLNTASSSAQFRIAPTTIAAAGFFTDGRMVEFDDVDGSGTRATGFFRIQDPSAFSAPSLTGPYVFRFSGWDASGGRFAMAGTAAADSGALTSVSADVNDAGAASGQLNGGSGTIGTIDGNGRGLATISVGTATYQLLCYVVDAGHLVFNSTAVATAGHPLITGEATAGSAGPFSQASLGDSHIFRLAGHTPGSPDVGIGVLHFDGAGAVSGNFFERSGGTGSATTLAGQHAVDPTTGRFTFSGTGVPAM